MPIYEYGCQDCGRKLAVFWRSRAAARTPTCQRCGSDNMTRLVSRVRVLRSEEGRMDSLADESALADLDENDPRSLGRWMRSMSQEMGEDLDPEMEEGALSQFELERRQRPWVLPGVRTRRARRRRTLWSRA